MSRSDRFDMVLVAGVFFFAPAVVFQPVRVQFHAQTGAFWYMQAALIIGQLTAVDDIPYPLVVVSVETMQGKGGDAIAPNNTTYGRLVRHRSPPCLPIGHSAQ